MNWKKITAFGTTALCATSLFAETYTWSGGGDGTSWSDAANWGGAAAPGSADYAKFSPMDGVSAVTVKPGELDAISVYEFTLDAGMPALTLDLEGKTLTTGSRRATHTWPANCVFTMKNGTFNWKYTATYNQAHQFGGGSTINLEEGAIVNWNTTPFSTSQSGMSINISGGSKWTITSNITGGTPTCQNYNLLVTGKDSSWSDTCSYNRLNSSLRAENGGYIKCGSYNDNFAGSTFCAEGSGSTFEMEIGKGTQPRSFSDMRLVAKDGGTMTLLAYTYNKVTGGISGKNTGLTIEVDNGTFKMPQSGSVLNFGANTSDAETPLGNPTFIVKGAAPLVSLACPSTFGSATEGLSEHPVVQFVVPETPWTTAPIQVSKKALTFNANVAFEIDASEMAAPEEGSPVNIPLVKASGTGGSLTVAEAARLAATMTVPDDCVGSLYVESNTLYFRVENSGGKQVVEVPEIESKVYTGELQTADVAEDEGYTVTANEGGTDVGAYPVVLTTKSGYVWSGTTEAETATNLTFVITKADNEWTTPPALSKTVWKVGEEAATTNNYATKFGETFAVVYDGDEELSAMPEEIGKHTVAITAVATTNWNALAATLTYYVTREDGTIPDVAPVTYTWTNAADGVWAEAGNWSANSDFCNGFPNDTKYATAVFGPLEGVDSLTVTPGELDEVKTYKLEFQSGMPTNIVFDMQGKSFETGVDWIDYGTYHHFLAGTAYTFKNGAFAMNQEQMKHASYMMHAGTVLNLVDGADVTWSTVPLGDGAYRVNVTGGSKWYARTTPTYGTYAMSGASVVVSGKGSSYDSSAGGDVTWRNCRYEARDGGNFYIYDFKDTFPGSSFLVEGSNSVMQLPAGFNASCTYANLAITARDGATFEFGARNNVNAKNDTGFAGDNSGLVLTVDDATVRTTAGYKQVFKFGTTVSEVAPQFIVKGAAPKVQFKCPATFGSDSFGTNSLDEVSAPVLAFEPPACGWAEAPIVALTKGKGDNVTASVTLASNLVIRASIADFKGKVDLVKVPKGYTLAADVKQLAANTVFEGVKRGEAKYEIVTTEDESTVLRATWKPAGGLIFFVE